MSLVEARTSIGMLPESLSGQRQSIQAGILDANPVLLQDVCGEHRTQKESGMGMPLWGR
jgi:hypothetical protein